MGLPQAVLAFKLLNASKLPHRDRQLVLTGADYSQKDNLFDPDESFIQKFHGEQAIPFEGNTPSLSDISATKIEPVYMANREENVLVASGNLNRNFGYPGRPSFFSGGRRNPSYRGAGWKSGASKEIGKPILHLQKDCPYNYENLGRVYLTEELSEDINLFTGSIKQEMSLLTYETRDAAVLDSARTSTVAGTQSGLIVL